MEERLMELEALKAIYEDDFSSSTTDLTTVCSVKLEDDRTLVTFSLPENYPEGVPVISVMSRGECVKELEAHLEHRAEQSRGEVMLYHLVEEAKNWLRKSRCTQDNENSHNIDEYLGTAKPAEKSGICQFFLSGKCRFGSKCFNKHELIDQAKGDCSLNDQSLYSQMKQVQKVSPNQLECVKEPEQSSQDSEMCSHHTVTSGTTSKKKPMKTASDVISRIQWDEKLNESNFVLGYLDRFVGIVEKPFIEFSWEDIASVDYNTLSIPQHRIQYFKYCDEIVWDKRSRIDRVFGSTGSGETILDVMTPTKPEMKCCREAVSAQKKLPLHVPELKDVSRGPSHYLSIEITDHQLCNEVHKLQQTACNLEPCLAHGVIPPAKLHVTLLMLTLKTDKDVTVAKQILKAVQPVLACLLPPTHLLDFQGLGSFKGRILYIPVKPNAELESLVKALKYKFQLAGICLEGNQDIFTPHLTVVRVTPSHEASANIQESFLSLETSYHDYMFGQSSFHSISLWTKSMPHNQEGSYKLLTIENSLTAVSSTLAGKLVQHLENLHMQGACTESERDELKHLLSTTDAHDMEDARSKLAGLSQSTASSLPSEQTRVLLILRGLPGSGKTYLAENSEESKHQENMRICSSCQLFKRRGDPASVDASEMGIGEAYCRTRFLEAMEASVPLVVIDDIHSQLWEYVLYKHIACAFGYTCYVMELHCPEPEDILACYQHCSTGQSLEHFQKLAHGWKKDPDAVAIKPWFKDPPQNTTASKSLLGLIGPHSPLDL